MSNVKTIYHGSTDLVKVPVYGHGKINNDYGIGFYCTDDNRAGSLWSVNKGDDVYEEYLLNDKTARLYFRQLLKESFNNGKTFVRDLLGGR